MGDRDTEKTVINQEIIDFLGTAGYPTTPKQLESWRRFGLLPKAISEGAGLGRGHGRAAARYDARDLAQALEIATSLTGTRSFREVRWRLWVDGFLVEYRWIYPLFVAAARLWDEGVRTLQQIADNESGFDQAVDAIFKAPASRFLRNARKSAGRRRFGDLVLDAAAITNGTFGQYLESSQDKEREALLKRMTAAMTLSRSSAEKRSGVPPIFGGDFTDILRDVSTAIGDRSMAQHLQSMPPSELHASALFLRNTTSIMSIGNELASTQGWRNAAFGRFSTLAELPSAQQAAFALAWSLVAPKIGRRSELADEKVSVLRQQLEQKLDQTRQPHKPDPSI